MSNNGFGRWAELMDREAAGETLSQAEMEFCRSFEEQNAQCRQELEFWRQMGEIETEPDDSSRALVDRALAKLESGSAKKEPVLADRFSAKMGFYRGKWLLVAAAAAVVVGGAVIGLKSGVTGLSKGVTPRAAETVSSRIELVYVSGQVLIDGKPGSVGQGLLAEGDELEVVCGSACIAIDPGIDVCVGERARLKLTHILAPERRIDLLSGRLTTILKPLPKGTSFSVAANGTLVTAVGTAFSVEITSERGDIETTVLSGKVSLGVHGTSHPVVAHQQVVVRGKYTRFSSVIRSTESRHWALIKPVELWQEASTAVLDLPSAPLQARVVLDGQPIGIAPLASLIPLGGHILEVQVGGRTIAEKAFTAEAGQATRIDLGLGSASPACQNYIEGSGLNATSKSALGSGESFGLALGASQEGNDPSPESAAIDRGEQSEKAKWQPSSLEQQIRRARVLMQARRWAEAAKVYRDIQSGYPDSSDAQVVLVPLGQIELNHLGRPELALQRFNSYIQYGGGGALAQEARYARISALRSLRQTSAEKQAIEEFLRLYPDSFETRVLRERLRAIGDSRE